MKKSSFAFKMLALFLGFALTVTVVASPTEVFASSKKKAKKPRATCTITFRNVNTDTVIKKGKRLKISYTAKSSNKKKVRIRFKSSNRRIATVSSKGVIKAKRNGTVKITATGYIRGRKSGRRTVKIKIGTPVSGVKLSGYSYLRAGRATIIKAAVSPPNATNKRLIWSSSNVRAVKVDQKGKVIGVGNGSAVITARAADGSGINKRITVYSHRYTKDDTHWIAHRGLHEKAKENTAEAFRLAGQSGFWGCECDIWETKHVQKEASTQEEQMVTSDTNNEMSDEASDDYETNPVVTDEDLDIVENTDTDEAFDIVISHDNNLKRVFGVDVNVENTPSEQIKTISQVCFFDEYLEICKQFGMVPIVEIKDYDMSDEGIAKFVDMVYERGLLDQAQFISFDSTVLERTKTYINETYGMDPYTGYLIGWGNVSASVSLAKEKGFTGINISYDLITPQVNKLCKDYGLMICTWTYNRNMHCDEMLYKHIVSGAYNVFSATTDGKFF